MEVLSKLFGGSGIVKILRLFLFNEESSYDLKDVSQKTRVDIDVVRSEVAMLFKIGFLKKRSFYKEVKPKKITRRKVSSSKKEPVKRKRVLGWTLDPDFAYLEALKGLLIGTAPLEERDIMNRLRKAGSIKLAIIAGVFVQNWDGRVDILIVSDNIKNNTLIKSLKEIESEIGREIRFAVFGTQDFKYRLSIYDKLVRDVLDYPHQKIIDRLGIF